MDLIVLKGYLQIGVVSGQQQKVIFQHKASSTKCLKMLNYIPVGLRKFCPTGLKSPGGLLLHFFTLTATFIPLLELFWTTSFIRWSQVALACLTNTLITPAGSIMNLKLLKS